jgi:hypothetical protein
MIDRTRVFVRQVAVSVALTFVLCGVGLRATPPKSFFPKRPQGVTPKSMQGVLTDYGIGNASGGFSIRDDKGKIVDFYTSWPMLIDGHPVKCAIAPTDTFKPHLQNCPDWPAQIRLGHTKVKVIYWSTTRDSKPVLVSDEIRRIP